MRDDHRVKATLSFTFEELDENGTVVRRSTEKHGVSHTMTTTNMVRTRFPDMEAQWVARKFGQSVADLLGNVLPPFLDGKTGQAFCPSTIHEGKEIPAPVSGVFINYLTPGVEPPVSYCFECAEMGVFTGMFKPDPAAPKSIFEVPENGN
ncbi:hypothetical protein SEA_ROSIEPOSIE_86 [Arthrobacter phage RosiePosie]|uniref:Uncharacterized protein n=12 Tax=Klausavirus princesstrina TaxID=1984784 RepID=A0A286N499_9CAUD|nr:hypothetical protein FDI82_gp087 [Arthrobacter phage PrincessTrina]ANU79686.1 hypothetical protein SEA_CONBOY_84 [Arthrobacter phage Conboy]AOZ64749.1 hypothetical protein SEA_CHOCOLAT_86 [Arthrobacter phage Chocolat]APC44768.1 hypothetical protein SEA_EDGARPOE_85 [Arthrobacter phage EdgarPoe]APC44880.1 hypothetical protein SEA_HUMPTYDUMPTY_86 [Arthrobacter phage HumptyDumpty]ASX98870.1 hypothetical protein SEA_KABREEZE_86 [Arthrobacter phage Kabreeze]ASX98981.1 hypothetical protein SEA_RO